ncbi:protein kinase family protein [Megalodesulfovibrio paquesii]
MTTTHPGGTPGGTPDDRARAKELILAYYPEFGQSRFGRLVTDTTEFSRIDYGDVIALETGHYLVYRNEAERRFGLEDPKYWVKRCRHLETGETKILKLVFHEHFPLRIGQLEILCHRSPEKEARILDLVRGDMRFMQGVCTLDAAGNNVRILDMVRGKPIDEVVSALEMDHATYFRTRFPDMLARFLNACEALAFLHSHHEKHGDVRRDHLFVEYGTGLCRWIDFDYAFQSNENPFGLDIWGLGNILLHLTGKDLYTTHDLHTRGFDPEILADLRPEDMSLMFTHRVMNLKKLFPYIPGTLNRVLMHFSAGAPVYYETVSEFLDDLRPVLQAMQPHGA